MLYDETATDTETLIKIAAKKVFLKKGFAGTRLQEIADEAGIGRTALHYYFRNKEKLFVAVLQDFFKEVVSRMPSFDDAQLPIIERMKHFVTDYMDTAIKSPEIDLFMLNEFNENPDLFREIRGSLDHDLPERFLAAIQRGVDKGEIAGEPNQILMTLMSMCMFPFAGMSMIKGIMGLSDETFMRLMQARKEHLLHIVETAFRP
ncbi:TetR/AcrR family transcriptional regulator [Chryseolinea soli]|uniref:TetR/AcrR family transcriptional regulator n=1 Tax=Chryseolinea soli TaxID=2321403 RepID=A0A385SQU1_9BACT|nr:TetR/AcrR family transcriptional regulator [Chryseolinea soli]AYB31890.1 TetR/AcrR family transcriptional regulator [Chryseolinea soli]